MNSNKRKEPPSAEYGRAKGDRSSFTPSSRFTPIEGGRDWTVSVAIAGSIIADTTSADQQIAAPGRIGRALAVFGIDEVIIFDDSPLDKRPKRPVDPRSYTADTDPCHFLTHVLSYLEVPPFMRKALFPLHQNLRLAGKLPSLDMPHHPHPNEWIPYREGVTSGKKGKATLVDIGLPNPIKVEEDIPPNTRVTLHVADPETTTASSPIHPTAPRTEGGYYWGYTVRKCSSLSAVFTESPYDEGYDVSIGTSERGKPVHRALPPPPPDANGIPLEFKHLLIVFGGPRGIEYAAGNDEDLAKVIAEGTKTRELFDYWVNVLPSPGSRTVRTDEALFIALTALGHLWNPSLQS